MKGERPMNQKAEDTIIIIDTIEPADGKHMDRLIRSRGLKDTLVKTSEYSVSYIKENMTNFIKSMQSILSDSAKAAGEFQIDKVEINAQVTGEGKIGFAGTGFNLQGASGIKITLKKSPDG